MDTDEFLEHFGVKGMKWGVRKKSPRPPRSRDARTAERLLAKRKNQGVRSLSNNDLQILNRRLQLERQLDQLNPQTSAFRRGLNLTREILGVGNTMNQVIQFSNSPSGQQVSDMLRRNN